MKKQYTFLRPLQKLKRKIILQPQGKNEMIKRHCKYCGKQLNRWQKKYCRGCSERVHLRRAIRTYRKKVTMRKNQSPKGHWDFIFRHFKETNSGDRKVKKQWTYA